MSTLQNGHLDEGTIHAWLDGALGAPEAAEVEAHLSACATCAAAVAEARGLIAGASRIVRALDDAQMTPTVASRADVVGTSRAGATRVGGAVPSVGGAGTAASGGSLWRLLRVTPKRAAIAATILVAVGVFATRKELGRDAVTPVGPTAGTTAVRPVAPAPEGAAPSSEAPATPAESASRFAAATRAESAASSIARDSVLESAIRRRLAISQPARTLERAPGMDIPQAPPPTVASAAAEKLEGKAGGLAPAAGKGIAGGTSLGVAGGVARSGVRADSGAKMAAGLAAVTTPAELSVASGRVMAAQFRDSAGGLAADQSRAGVIGKVASSGGSANTTIRLRSPAPAAALPKTGGLSGDWRGESTCQVHVPICEEEPVVYHVIGSPSGYQLVMNRLRGTVEEYNALLECVLTAEGMECPTDLGKWRFRVDGNEMTGEFVGKDGVVVRAVKVRRE